MPIRPENLARYPKDWKAISLRIRKRARQRCECRGECGKDHFKESNSERCLARNKKPHWITGSIVVLTTAHLNHTPEDCRPENLKAMCQRCHLNMDRHIHRRNSWETRRARKALGDLLGECNSNRKGR